MKRYRLIKDLPFAKAGEIFESKILDDCEEYLFWGEVKTEKIENFDEWFEEIEPRWTKYWYITDIGNIVTISVRSSEIDTFPTNVHKEIGNYFETKQEAEKHFEWIKARAILIQDTKGFKPDWTDSGQSRYQIEYDYEDCEFDVWSGRSKKYYEIPFGTREDAKNSLEAHEKEWRIYLQCQD